VDVHCQQKQLAFPAHVLLINGFQLCQKKKKKMSKFNVEKIPIKTIIEGLVDLYEKGFDFFDINGITNEDQDVMYITVKKEYLSKKEGNIDYEELI